MADYVVCSVQVVQGNMSTDKGVAYWEPDALYLYGPVTESVNHSVSQLVYEHESE